MKYKTGQLFLDDKQEIVAKEYNCNNYFSFLLKHQKNGLKPIQLNFDILIQLISFYFF